MDVKYNGIDGELLSPFSVKFEYTTDDFIKTIEEICDMQESTDADGFTIGLRIKEIFETNFGIRDHSPKGYNSSIMPLSTFNPVKNTIINSPLRREFVKLLDIKAPSRTGSSVVDLMKLPYDVYNELIEAVEEYNLNESKLGASMMDDIEND